MPFGMVVSLGVGASSGQRFHLAAPLSAPIFSAWLPHLAQDAARTSSISVCAARCGWSLWRSRVLLRVFVRRIADRWLVRLPRPSNRPTQQAKRQPVGRSARRGRARITRDAYCRVCSTSLRCPSVLCPLSCEPPRTVERLSVRQCVCVRTPPYSHRLYAIDDVVLSANRQRPPPLRGRHHESVIRHARIQHGVCQSRRCCPNQQCGLRVATAASRLVQVHVGTLPPSARGRTHHSNPHDALLTAATSSLA